MASDGNLGNATKTYEGFLSMMKWGTIFAMGLGAIVVLLISS